MRNIFILAVLGAFMLVSTPSPAQAGKVSLRAAPQKLPLQSEHPDHADLPPEQLDLDKQKTQPQAAANSTGSSPHLSGTPPDEPPVNNSGTEMYLQVHYADASHEKVARVHGFDYIKLHTGWYFFPPGHDMENVDEAVEERVRWYAQTKITPGDRIVLDIEHWRTDVGVSSEERAESVQKMLQVYDIILDELTNLYGEDHGTEFGWYSMAPSRNYWDVYENCAWAPYRHDLCVANQQAWYDVNTELLPLIERMDFIAPSVYTFYNHPEGWTHYARANIEEARRLADLAGGKPVYAYIWPRYHGSNNDGLAYTPIDGAFWRHQLEVVNRTSADGMIIWDHSSTLTIEDVRAEEWFGVTLRFLGQNGENDQDHPRNAPPTSSHGDRSLKNARN